MTLLMYAGIFIVVSFSWKLVNEVLYPTKKRLGADEKKRLTTNDELDRLHEIVIDLGKGKFEYKEEKEVKSEIIKPDINVGKIMFNDSVSNFKEINLYQLCESFIGMIKAGLESKMKTKEEAMLEKHGFTSSKNYTYEVTTEELELFTTFEYYNTKYPKNLFIPKSIVDVDENGKITIDMGFDNNGEKSNAKFELDFIDPTNYNKIVPGDSLDDIDNFKITKKDISIYITNTENEIKETYSELVDFLSRTYHGDHTNDKTAQSRLKLISSDKGYVITHDTYTDIFYQNNNIDPDKYPILKIKRNSAKKLLILEKNSNKNEKMSFNEYVELEQDPNKDIDVLVLKPVAKGYLVVTGW